jgi:hypothetical protein
MSANGKSSVILLIPLVREETQGVMPGSLLKVRLKDYLAFDDARYCIPAAEGFFVGVQLHDYIPHGGVPKNIGRRKET